MLSFMSLGASLALLVLGVESFGDDHHHLFNGSTIQDPSTIFDPTCTGNVTVIERTTIVSPTTIPVTHYVNITIPHYVNVTFKSTETQIVSTNVTEVDTTTLHHTVSVTETETDSETITNTRTTTNTVPATVTTYTTTTVISTKVDPCPSTCSLSAATVNVFFWPTDRPYSYPSTYVDTDLDYTFTSPSVYILIPTIKGTNSLGAAGPTSTKWIIPQDLEEVSTISDGTTRQLTLSDLGTDCPQSAEAGAIATMVDSRCDPILAAPKTVSSWANPCNACGRLGLFDPPYAIPTVTGGLIETTTAKPVETTEPPKTTVVPAPTTSPMGVIVLVSYVDGEAVATGRITTSGVDGTVTSSIDVTPTDTPDTSSEVESSPASATTEVSSPPETTDSSPPETTDSSPTTEQEASPSTSPATVPTSPTAVVTGSAGKVTGGFSWFISAMLAAVLLI